MNEHGALFEWYWQGKADILGEIPFANRLARNWTRAFAIRGRWQVAWSMAQPVNFSAYQSRKACEIILDIRRDILLPLKYTSRRRNKRIFCFVAQQYLRKILILLLCCPYFGKAYCPHMPSRRFWSEWKASGHYDPRKWKRNHVPPLE
jgi:hypothetical protein